MTTALAGRSNQPALLPHRPFAEEAMIIPQLKHPEPCTQRSMFSHVTCPAQSPCLLDPNGRHASSVVVSPKQHRDDLMLSASKQQLSSIKVCVHEMSWGFIGSYLQLDPAQYRENRIKAVEAKKAKGVNPYPHKFQVRALVAALPTALQRHAAPCVPGCRPRVESGVQGSAAVRAIWQVTCRACWRLYC